MAILSRLARAVAARVNGLFDQAAGQEEQAARLLEEMEHGLTEVRRLSALAITAARRFGLELERNRTAAASRHHGYENLVYELEARHAAAVLAGERIKAFLCAFETRLDQARNRQRSLRARRRAAQAWNAIHQRGERLFPLLEELRTRTTRLEDQLQQMEDALTDRAEANQLLGRLER